MKNVANGSVNEWFQDFVLVWQLYCENNIFKIDETKVCYDLLHDHSLYFKGVKSHGDAKSK